MATKIPKAGEPWGWAIKFPDGTYQQDIHESEVACYKLACSWNAGPIVAVPMFPGAVPDKRPGCKAEILEGIWGALTDLKLGGGVTCLRDKVDATIDRLIEHEQGVMYCNP